MYREFPCYQLQHVAVMVACELCQLLTMYTLNYLQMGLQEISKRRYPKKPLTFWNKETISKPRPDAIGVKLSCILLLWVMNIISNFIGL